MAAPESGAAGDEGDCGARPSVSRKARSDLPLHRDGASFDHPDRPRAVADRRTSRSFNLLRWFSLLSLICVVLLSAALATILSRFMTKALLQRDASISSQFVESLSHAEGAWSHFEAAQAKRPDPQIVEFFKTFYEQFLLQSDVIRANAYAQDQTVIWSSTHSLIGTRFGQNEDLEGALQGRVMVELGTVGVDDKAEHVEFEPALRGERYIETYIPVWSPDHQTVVGVVEIYRLSGELFSAIDSGTRLVWVCSLAGGALLYLALFGIVRRASTVIDQQHARLAESEFMAAIGEMASAIAHGIRNPLASIRSSAELVALLDPDGARGAARDIVNSIDRLSEWIRSFLHQTHVDEIESTKVDFNEIIRSSLADFGTAMNRQHVELVVDLADGLPPVRGHPVILKHVINGLVANALEAMPKGGTLEIMTHAGHRGQTVEVVIADNGGGISATMNDRLFSSFATTKREGIGMGLALSRRVIVRSGGTIELTSTDGHGARVTIRMPAAT